ncbi:hypothetical protein TNCV_2833381 [Trichonephila clavipes]|nr:hypothetical protein TNCV_2833381 [Trichonephila clavipes]
MTKSPPVGVTAASIVGYNRCHRPHHRIKEALDVFLRYRSSCGYHILQKLIWYTAVKSNTTPNHDTGCSTSTAMHNETVQQPLTTVSPNSNPTIVMLQAEARFASKHSVAPFRYPCPPFIVPLAVKTPVVSSQV